jgi:hypothetical protein
MEAMEIDAQFKDIWLWLQDHQSLLGWTGLISLAMAVTTILTLPIIIVALPPRYLIEQDEGLSHIAAPLRWLYLIVKNCIGALLALAGLAMLILPGQGLLTLMIGLALMNFPGKHRLILRIIGQQRILTIINRLRAKAHKPPLEAPQTPAGT